MDKTEPDYSRYSLAQLYDIKDHINQEKFKERYESVLREIAKKEAIAGNDDNGFSRQNEIFRGSVQSTKSVILLSIITLGLYTIYWAYTSIVEINDYFEYYKSKNSSTTARTLYRFYLITAAIFIVVSVFAHNILGKENLITHPLFLLASFAMTVFHLVVYYHFVSSVRLAQMQIETNTLKVWPIFLWYVACSITGWFHFVIPFITLFSFIFLLLFVQHLQTEINKIWQKVEESKTLKMPGLCK